MDSRQAFMLYACPALGAVVAFGMFISPMRAVLRVNSKKEFGEINPIPFVFMAANGMGWLAYGLYIHDYFVFCSNISALLLGLFYVMTCSKFSSEKIADQLRNILLCVCAVFMAMALVFMAADLGPQGERMLWGILANAMLAVYYVTPLTTLTKVLATRDSSSLHKPMLVANIVNGLLWFAYGLAIHDLMLVVPNGFGAGFNFLSLGISLMFPARAHTIASNNGENNNNNNLASPPVSRVHSQHGSFVVERSASKTVLWLAQKYHESIGAVRIIWGGHTAAAAGGGQAGNAYNGRLHNDNNTKNNSSDTGSGDADVEAAIDREWDGGMKKAVAI